MKSLTRWVRRSMFKSLHKSFNVVVIVALLLQPVGTVGVYGAFSFSRGVPIATAVETEPATPTVVDAPADVTPPKEEVVAPVVAVPVVEEKTVPADTPPVEVTPSVTTPAETPILTPSIGDTGATTENTEALPATTEETTATSQNAPLADEAAPPIDTTIVPADPVIAVSETAVSPKETWSTDGNKSVTNNSVEQGKTYVAPQNDQVTVTFTKLPENPGTLSIEELTLTNEQVVSLHALSNKAYDITSDMADGTFEYELTLPKAESEKNVQIKFAEDVAGLENADTVASGDVETKNTSVNVTLDHFTIFVVVNPNTQPNCDAVSAGTTIGVTCFDTLDAAIAAAGNNTTIKVGAGIYTLTTTLNITQTNLTIAGKPGMTVIQGGIGVGLNFFNITGSGFTLQDVELVKTDKAGEQRLLAINANNVTIKDNIIHGQFVIGEGDVSRAMIISGGLTGLLIDGNTIYSLRQPMYLTGPTTGTISNNFTYLTKGWVLEGGNVTFTGNTWGTGANTNVYDIAILSIAPSTAYTDIVAMSNTNNEAVIEDQRVAPAVLSVVYVDAGTSFASDLGGKYHPYASITPALTRVVEGGTVHVANGNYSEAINVLKKGTHLLGESKAGVVVTSSGTTPSGHAVSVEGVDDVTLSQITFNTSATASQSYALKAYMAKNLTLKDLDFNGPGTAVLPRIGGVDVNSVEGITIDDVSAKNYSKNGFSFTANCDTGMFTKDVVLKNITAQDVAWSDIAFYTKAGPSCTPSEGDITGVTFTGTNTVKNAGHSGLQIGDSGDSATNEVSGPSGVKLDLGNFVFDGTFGFGYISNVQKNDVIATSANFDGDTNPDTIETKILHDCVSSPYPHGACNGGSDLSSEYGSVDYARVTLGENKVDICHATSSSNNPYTSNSVSINSVSKCLDVNGHGDHTGDIIPSYTTANCFYPGKNWDVAGQAIWNNQCEPVSVAPSCGDGIVNNNEACDYGTLNGSSTCSESCQWNAPVCLVESTNVTNGEFETPDVTNGAQWDIFNNSQVPGWTAEWYGGASTFGEVNRPDPKIEIHSGVNGWTTGSDQYVELDSDWDGPAGSLNGEPASIALSQTIPTVVGNEYTISFDYAARPNHNDNRLSFKVNGSEKFDSGNLVGGGSVSWHTQSYTFTATGTSTILSFTETGTPDSYGMFLDNVRIGCSEAVKVCGDGKVNQTSEQCDGTDGVTAGMFCSANCQLIPQYDGPGFCPTDKPVKKLIDTYIVSSQDADGITVPVTSGTTYLFEASGTFNPTSASGYESDAAYTKVNGVVSGLYGIHGTGNDYAAHALLGDLGSGVGVIDWGAQTDTHIYNEAYTPSTTGNAQFVIGDRYSNWFVTPYQNQSGMNDNQGDLILKQYECQAKSEVKVCKVNATGAPLSGWNVFLKGDKVDTVSVLPTGATYSSSVLPTDDYILEANGTYTYRGTPGAEYTDANYSKRAPSDSVYGGPYVPWVNVNTFPNPNTGWPGVMVDGSATDWSSYFNPAHQYVLGEPNHTGAFDFKILDDVYSDNSGSILVDIYKGYAGVTRNDGCVTFTDVPLGTYTTGEVMQDGWENVSGIGSAVVNDAKETFTLENREIPKPAKISAEKVVCDNESYLPNMSGGADITATTASNWVAQSNNHCHIEPDWNFQWSRNGGSFGVFQTNTASLGSPWQTFSGETPLPLDVLGQKVEVREVFPNTMYVPFTNAGDVSAEIYCADDVANYDNWEWIQNIQADTTYHCVAFNALKKATLSINKVCLPSTNGLEKFNLQIDGANVTTDTLCGGSTNGPIEVTPGSHTVGETGGSGTNLSDYTSVISGDCAPDGTVSLTAGENKSCTITNTKKPPVTVVATKVVCTDEADLPNWGAGPSNNITALTAQRWVNIHPNCHIEQDWQFQWSLDNVGNPGDNIESAGSGWNTFNAGSVEINNPDTSRLWFREALKPDYIPFTYGATGNANNVSAEFYCNSDVLNYDNWEWIDTVPGQTYYCVAWNVKLESIHGFKWDDLNGNGQYDCNVTPTAFARIAPICEPKLPGWTINLYQWNGEEYDTTPLRSMVTSNDEGEEFGWYWFENLLPGKYQVCEESQPGWTQTFPGDPNCHEVILPNGEPDTENSISAPEYDFGNVHFGTITVTKYEDSNGNGTRDGEEDTLPEWDMHLSQGDLFSRTQSTDDSGQTTFADLLSGMYTLSEPGVEDWTLTNISCLNDIRGEDSFAETIVIDNDNEHPVSVAAGETVTCEVGNMHTPRLSIEKWKDGTSTRHPGDTVRYHIRVTAHDNDVLGVSVTDLPSAGFVYVGGSAVADQGGLTHTYASPGIWTLGDMTAGQSIELAYDATISGTQDAGNYRDLAYATGNSEANTGESADVIAEDPIDSDNFVGTEVAVALPTSLAVQLDEKTKTKTETHKKIKQVLGASTLPATGANSLWMALAIAMLALGLWMILIARRRKTLTMNNSNGMMTKTALLFILSVSAFTLPSMVSAADPNISVRIETPKAIVNSPDFKIGFVVLDISNGTPNVVCEVNNGGGFTDFPVAHIEYAAQPGGNSGNCVVDATVMPADGDYTFRVTADDSVSSDEVPVELVSAVPGTPLNYNREKNSCGVSFTTANDGLTTAVELYRSTSSTFVADASTLSTTLLIAPNTNGAMIDPGADCRDYFYAIRAVSASGAGSGFVGDDNVNVKHKTKTKTVTETIAGPSTGGAIPVTGGGAAVVGGEVTPGTEGSVQGAETENLSGENGSVLGEETTAGGSNSWVGNHPWWSALIALALLALGYRGYQVYQKKRNEQPLQ